MGSQNLTWPVCDVIPNALWLEEVVSNKSTNTLLQVNIPGICILPQKHFSVGFFFSLVLLTFVYTYLYLLLLRLEKQNIDVTFAFFFIKKFLFHVNHLII